MNTGIYIRVSTEEQVREGYSIAAQRERLISFAHSQDWDVVDFYVDEGKSAKDTDRPELQRLLNDVRNRKINVILVYKLDRLTRNVADLYSLLNQFEKYDVGFRSAQESFDTTTPMGRAMIGMLGIFAQWERETIAERVSFGLEQRVREGEWHGGRTPFGYDYDTKGLQIIEKEAFVVREIYRLYLSGIGDQKLAKWLNERGYRSRRGFPFEQKTIRRILTNPTYTGKLHWNLGESDGFVVDGVVPPIIDEETFQRVQTAREHRFTMHPRQATSPYIFSGFLKCARCGGRMSGKKNRQSYSYTCIERVNHGLCDMPYVHEPILEKAFLDYLENQIALIQEQAKATALEVAASRENKAEQKHDTEITSLERELDQLKAERKRMQQGFIAGLIESEELASFLDQNRSREQHILSALEELQSEEEQTEFAGYEALIDLKENWYALTSQDKKDVLGDLLESITIDAPDKPARGRYAHKAQVELKEVVFKATL